jgi:hypothetical protein
MRPHRIPNAPAVRRILDRAKTQRPRRFKVHQAQQEGIKA